MPRNAHRPGSQAACALCGLRPRVTRSRCEACTGVRRHASAIIDGHTRYEYDVAAQLFVDAFHRHDFPGEVTLEMIGDALGITREAVRQIEARALEGFRLRLRLAGVDAEDLAMALGGRSVRGRDGVWRAA